MRFHVEPCTEGNVGGVALTNLQADAQNGFFKGQVLKKSLSFARVKEDNLNKLAAHATIRYFRKKEFIFHEGDPANRLCIVQYGRVKLFKASASGKDFVAHIAGPGNTLNVAGLFGKNLIIISQRNA